MITTKNKQPKFLINEQITYKQVLLVYADNSSELIDTTLALEKARELKLDLILLNIKANPPVAKILDNGKFLYELKKKNKNNNKNVTKVKSITVKPKIDMHDLQWKSKQAVDWFKTGDRVLFVVKAYGRLSVRLDLINAVFDAFVELITPHGIAKEPLKQISKVQFATYFFPNNK